MPKCDFNKVAELLFTLKSSENHRWSISEAILFDKWVPFA